MTERTSAGTWIRIATSVTDEAIAGTVQSMHRAITDANFRWAGPLGRPVQAVHDVVVDRTWSAVHAGLRGAGVLAVAVAERAGTAADDSPGTARARAIAIGSVDAGLIAAAPGFDHDVMLISARPSTSDADPTERSGAQAEVTDRLAVFVHGLVDTEAMWTTTSLAHVVQDAGATPLLVRYASGRSIAANGLGLADLLEDVVSGWPVPVTRVVILGHSMGGLVARAAAASAERRDQRWPGLVSDVVHLATPHLGSWLEKVANATSWTLRRASTRTAPLGHLLDRRSRGIKDLRFGALADRWWGDGSIDDLQWGPTEYEPWPREVVHHLVVGRLRPGARHVLNTALGDGLVRATSASATGRWSRVPPAGNVRVTSVAAGHNEIAGHPDVAALVASVLEGP